MKKIDKKKYPIDLLREIQTLQNALYKVYNDNQDIILDISEDSSSLFHFIDKDKEFNFYFTVNIKKVQKDLQQIFAFKLRPYQESNLNSLESAVDDNTTVVKMFEEFSRIIRLYNNIEFGREEAFYKQYQQEFYVDLENTDEDASTMPLEHEKQVLTQKLLTYIIEQTATADISADEATQIVTEAEDLRKNITRLTKQEVAKQLAKVLAKVKKASLSFLQSLWDGAKKEAIKRLITGAVDEVSSFAHQLPHMF